MDVLIFSNVTKNYGQGKGIFDIDFSVQKGEVFGFLGPNGSGKTTAIRHLMGFANPDKGSCTINGMDCRKESAKIQKNLGYIPGEIAFLDSMTGKSFISFIASYRGMTDLSRANALMERFELDPSGKLSKMSKGMKQKVGIVCAFMHDPDVLILDEPTSGLDPLMQNRFIDLILEEKDKGKTIFMSSHLFEEVERTCSRVGIIKAGRLMTVDSIDHLKRSSTKKFTVTFASEGEALRFGGEQLEIIGQRGKHATVVVRDNMQAFISSLNKYPVTDLQEVKQSLEDVFLHFYGGGDQ